jgi:hypothetical protein
MPIEGDPFTDNPTPPNSVPVTMTGTDIAADVRAKFGDESGVQLDDEMLLRWINNGQRRLASGAPWIKRSVTTALLQGIGTYDLGAIASDLVAVDSLLVNGKFVPLISWVDYQNRVGGGIDIDDPTIDRTAFAAVYANRINLYPIPAETIADGVILYFDSLPAAITSLTDQLSVPDRLFNALNDYVLQQALELDERFEEAEVKRGHTESAIREQIVADQSPSGYYPQISQVGADEW